MNRPKVYLAQKVPAEVEEYIGKHCDYEKWTGKERISQSELITKLQDVEGLVIWKNKIDEELLQHAPKLKAVSTVSVGYNNFDLNAMKKRNVLGMNTPHVLDNTVADLVFSLILSTARRIPELDKYVKDGKWKPEDNGVFFGVDVHHATLGIVGLGRIGETIARRAKYGFDMNVIYHNRHRKYEAEKELGVEYSEFDDLVKKADFILVMTPLTPETHHLFDTEEFENMKNTAVFINASRGEVVNEAALIEALQQNKIFGAGLDVYEKEPVSKDNPLLKLSNVVTTPHIGSATYKTRFDMAMLAAESLVKALKGENPDNIVPELRK